ncbi:hypothetical protein SDC9_97813 [bioreactor metagenome]|uniref:Uncharacterized protein n=1 Tax=bioreactor metagenome TaxID=1076179 RepID=A0A645ADG3_9ZZZZ
MNDLHGDGFFAAWNIDVAQTLFNALGLIPNMGIRRDGTRVNAEVGLFTHERICSGLPHVDGQRSRIAGGQGFLAGFAFGNHSGAIFGGGQQVNNVVQQAADTDLGSGGADENRYVTAGANNGGKAFDHFFFA